MSSWLVDNVCAGNNIGAVPLAKIAVAGFHLQSEEPSRRPSAFDKFISAPKGIFNDYRRFTAG